MRRPAPWTDDLADLALTDAIDEAMRDSEERAGEKLDYRKGCPACCVGPFAITALDARRLRRGLAALSYTDPARAKAVKERAAAARADMAATFPGDAATGILGPNETEEEAFYEQFSKMPCPALDPSTSRCDLYKSRPISCRTYGPPVQYGSVSLPPCHLCFPGATHENCRDCEAVPDPRGKETRLIRALARRLGVKGDTVVAFALEGKADGT